MTLNSFLSYAWNSMQFHPEAIQPPNAVNTIPETQVTMAKHFFVMTQFLPGHTPPPLQWRKFSEADLHIPFQGEWDRMFASGGKEKSNKLVISLTRWTESSMVYKLDCDTYGLAPIW